MASFPKVKSLILAGSLSILLSAAMQEAVQAEPVVSSYYGGELAGSPTASGEPFDPRGLTAAHPSLPLGTMLTVSYNGRSVNVRVNDRGPHVAGRGLDLSLGAAQNLGLTGPGAGVVDIKSAGVPEAMPPIPDNVTPEPLQRTRTAPTTETAPPAEIEESTGTTPSNEVQEPAESPESLSESLLTPPGERIVDSAGNVSSLRPQSINSRYEPAFFEEPSATQVPKIREDQAVQTLHGHPIASARRRSA